VPQGYCFVSIAFRPTVIAVIVPTSFKPERGVVAP
jgi:hypothetical protein